MMTRRNEPAAHDLAVGRAHDLEGPSEWLEAILRTALNYSFVCALTIWPLWMLFRLPPKMDLTSGTLLGCLLVLGAARAMTFLSYGARCCLLLGSYCAILVVGLATLGPAPGLVVLMVTNVMLATVLLGRNAGVAMVLGGAALFLGLGPLSQHGFVSSRPDDFSLLATRNWIRYSVSFVCLASLTIVVSSSLFGRADRNYRRALEALRSLEAEKVESARLDGERHKAERAFLAAQKLEAVGRLAGGIAHDFNNSLLVIMTWADLLRQEQDIQVREEGLQAISHAALQASQMTRQLVCIARAEIGNPRELEVDEFLRKMVVTLRRVLPAQVKIELQAGPTPSLFMDDGQLSQILLNLTINAHDAMPLGGILTLRSTLVRADDLPKDVAEPTLDHVEVAVTDTGQGMDSATIAQIFDPFFTTKGPGKGTGLGLSSVQGIVTQNRGYLRVESRVGSGTTFRFGIPLFQKSDAAVKPSLRQKGRAALSSRIVLVVEDLSTVRHAISKALEEAGCSVLHASDGKSAIELLRRFTGHIDLLCTDAMMPGVPVASLLATFAECFPNSPVLLCSGHVMDDSLRRDVEQGKFAFLAKPFSATQLLAKVHELLCDRDGTRPLELG